MTSYSHILCLEFYSYGAALAALNETVNDNSIKAFEVSPAGSLGLLILVSNSLSELKAAQGLIQKNHIATLANSSLIEAANENLLMTYLSQNKPNLKPHLAVYEFGFFGQALTFANQALSKGFDLVDFRVIRTAPLNAIVFVSSEKKEGLSLLSPSFGKKQIILNTTDVLKSYFQT